MLRGAGPGNTQRLTDRQKAWEDGAWVREGLMAHAEKKAARKVAAE